MTDERTFRPGRILTACTFLALVILLSLGTWQWRKIGPKTAWIAQIEAGLSEMPVPLRTLDPGEDNAYRRVWADGRFKDAPPLRLYGTNLSGRPGYHHYALLSLQDGTEVVTSLGWVPFEDTTLRVSVPPPGRYSGVLMSAGTKGGFTPDNDPVGNEWFWADLTAMAAALGAETVFPYRLILDHVGRASDLPRGGQVRVDVPNDHFEYALTWYGLALSLLGVYVFFGYRRR